MNTHEITEQFFRWMDEEGVNRSEIAPLLGVDQRSLSTYRSRGLPLKKIARAEKIMREWQEGKTAPIQDNTRENSRLVVEFEDDDFKTIEQAVAMVSGTATEFVRKSAIHMAREIIAKENGHQGNGTNG